MVGQSCAWRVCTGWLPFAGPTGSTCSDVFVDVRQNAANAYLALISTSSWAVAVLPMRGSVTACVRTNSSRATSSNHLLRVKPYTKRKYSATPTFDGNTEPCASGLDCDSQGGTHWELKISIAWDTCGSSIRPTRHSIGSLSTQSILQQKRRSPSREGIRDKSVVRRVVAPRGSRIVAP